MAKTFDDKKIIYTMDRVSRAYGTKVVLKDISISYYYGAKIGVIGENGAGKSSLFKIFAGIDKDYTGETKLLPGYSMGYLEQEPYLEPGKTVMEIVQEGVKPITDLLEEFDKVIGLDRLLVVHVNDSKNPAGAHKDRHENIGYGYLGFDVLCKVVHHPRLKGIPMILETPYYNEKAPYKQEIAMLRSSKYVDNWRN